MAFNLMEISRTRLKQSKNSYVHPVNLCCGVFCEVLVDFWVYLGGESFFRRNGKVKKNKKY